MVQGKKHDHGKPRLGLLPFDALLEVAKVMTAGATKYGAHNWAAGLAYERVYSALLRHLAAWWQGEKTDEETGLHSLGHAACCVLFLLAYELRGMREWDDRPPTDPVKVSEECFDWGKDIVEVPDRPIPYSVVVMKDAYTVQKRFQEPKRPRPRKTPRKRVLAKSH